MRHIIIRFLLPVLLVTSGCIFKQSHSSVALRNQSIPIFLEMPRNNFVFEHVAPTLYQAMHRHLLRVGYKLVDKNSDGYTIRLTIIKLHPSTKYVSSQVTLLGQEMTLDVQCELLDFKQKVIVEKKFSFSRLLSKPQHPSMNSDFEDYVYTQLCQHAAPRIEFFVRAPLLKAFKNN